MTRRRSLRRIACAGGLLLGALALAGDAFAAQWFIEGGDGTGRAAPAAPPAPSFTAKEPPWKQYPILMVNLTPEDLAEVADLIDVALYYTSFAPYDDDLDAFRFDERTLPMLQSAAAHDLSVAITLTPFADASLATAEEPDPAALGDGVRVWVDDHYVLFDATGTVRIPIGPQDKDAITPAFIDYWAAKLDAVLDAATGADEAHALYGWYGIDELRWWRPEQDYGLALALRDAVRAHPKASGRPILAYTPTHYASLDLGRTLLQTPASGSPSSPLTVPLAPLAPASFGWAAGEGAWPLFPTWERFARDAAGLLRPVQQHVLQGAYVGRMIGAYGHVNRLLVLHRADVAREAVGIARVAHHTNQEPAPENLAISGPDLDAGSLALSQPTPAEARHDFWASVLRGQGIFLYNYRHKVLAEAVDPPTPASATLLATWAEYASGLSLLKSTLRRFLVEGTRLDLEIEILSDALEVVPGTDYVDSGAPALQAEWLVLPDYPALNGAAWRIGDVAYVIVTSSYAQPVAFSFELDGVVCSVEELSGAGGRVALRSGTLSDHVPGIEGRVYRVAFARAPLGSCDLAQP